MDASTEAETRGRWNAYVDELGRDLRDKRQRASFALYALGLLSDGERKSMEPLAARACGDPSRTHALCSMRLRYKTRPRCGFLIAMAN